MREEINELLAMRQQLIVSGDLILTAQVDVVLLRLMLRNLLENASRYNPQDSTITLNITAINDGSEVTVCDEGPGIEETAVREVLKAFHWMDQRYGGSGLGLNIYCPTHYPDSPRQF